MDNIHKNSKTIRLAEPSGFCYGVSNAVQAVHRQLEMAINGGFRPIYTYGPIIHNKITIDELTASGVIIANSVAEMQPDSTVIIRAHGIPASIEKEMQHHGMHLVDATCPHVKHIHKIVEEASTGGRPIIIVGNPAHPEVAGTRGRCSGTCFVVQKPEDLAHITDIRDSFDGSTPAPLVVAQTTISQEMWSSCTDEILKAFPRARLKCTICQATVQRQNACRELASQSDAMIIIGDRNSSNSVKLFEIAREYCKKVFFVETFEDLPLKHMRKCNRIGVSASASVPARIIKEVISAMSEYNITNEETNNMQDFMEEIEKSLRIPGRGEIVTGEVIQVNDREVSINLGCNKEGVIPKEEIALKDGETLPELFKEGDSVQAKVIKTDDGYGNILLSRKKLEVTEHWEEILAAYEEKSILEVKVLREVRSGVIAAYKEVTGFIPLSQLSDKYTEKADAFIGQTLEVKVTRVDQKRNKAVFSHKVVLNERKAQKIAEVWEKLNVGDNVEGTVMRFTDYGAFVDIGGIDGLLHISEISWGKLRHPKEILKIGQTVNVKILSMSQETGKISLGLKQNTPEPWSVIHEKYQAGQTVEGKVVQIKEYGAFVELEPGLDGLVHISEIAFRRVANIGDELTVGQDIQAKILEIDEEKRRISLSIKATMDPEEAAEEAPAEEAPAEEAPVEEAPAEAVEEAPAAEAE